MDSGYLLENGVSEISSVEVLLRCVRLDRGKAWGALETGISSALVCVLSAWLSLLGEDLGGTDDLGEEIAWRMGCVQQYMALHSSLWYETETSREAGDHYF